MNDKYSVTTPCPFCGARLVERNHPGGRSMNDFNYSYHQCPTIECLLHWVEVKFEDREKWNTRAQSPSDAKLEAIREALEKHREGAAEPYLIPGGAKEVLDTLFCDIERLLRAE